MLGVHQTSDEGGVFLGSKNSLCKGPEVRKQLETVRQPAWLEWDEVRKNGPDRVIC